MQDRHVVGGSMPPLAMAIAPGCDSSHPTRIGGEIYGYSDHRAVNALIGVDAKDGGVQVDRDGRPRGDPEADFCGGYSWCIRVNPEVGPEGTTDPDAVRVWGTGGEGCVSAKIDQVFIEIYPQVHHEPGGNSTDFTRYGAASHYYQPITPGRNNKVLLRLPVRHEQGGNTGYVNGYITYQGRPVPDPLDDNLVIRAFSHGRGPDCGIEGFAASAEKLQQNSSGTATYYRTPPLAAGRCGATYQRYSIKVTCKLLPGSGPVTKHVDITRGIGKRIDFAF
jgi:hypothetical protein